MSTFQEVVGILDDVLQLGDKVASFDEETPLLGSVAEFDSMAVVSVITALEDNYGFEVDDDEIDGEVFETVGSLVSFVSKKLEG